jgi:hypothetical protein
MTRISSRSVEIILPTLLLSLFMLAASRQGGVASAFSPGIMDNRRRLGNRCYNNFASSATSPTMITTTSETKTATSASSINIRTMSVTTTSSTLFSTNGMATLTEDTTWRLRLLLDGVTTTKGRKLRGPTLFVLEGHFIEEEGYEPPQGFFRSILRRRSDENERSTSSSTTTKTTTITADPKVQEAERVMALELAGSRWKLSEDPNDPRDGLWVWGLFKEPLYPFLLLQMETKELILEENSDAGIGDSLPALKLYAQVPHVRSKKVEGDVVLSTANLNVRVLEQVKLPGATVDLFEEEVVGKVSFQPIP